MNLEVADSVPPLGAHNHHMAAMASANMCYIMCNTSENTPDMTYIVHRMAILKGKKKQHIQCSPDNVMDIGIPTIRKAHFGQLTCQFFKHAEPPEIFPVLDKK